jgi:hypothetical protein
MKKLMIPMFLALFAVLIFTGVAHASGDRFHMWHDEDQEDSEDFSPNSPPSPPSPPSPAKPAPKPVVKTVPKLAAPTPTNPPVVAQPPAVQAPLPTSSLECTMKC